MNVQLLRSLLVLSLATALATALASCARERQATQLPFYSSPELTPTWIDDAEATRAHRVGTFALVDQSGAAFSDADVAGRIYVASFIFTRCGGICPTMVRNLSRIQTAFATDDDVLLVSHSVDPRADSVDVLKAFATERGIDYEHWRLLTGDREAIYRLARSSYFADDDAGREIGPNDFLHTEKVLLIDRERRIRGVYNGTLPPDMDRLIDDIRTLQRAG